MLLVGYHSTSAYKLYYPETNKVEVSRDVVVKESEAWDWNKSQSDSGVIPTPELASEDVLESSEDESDSEDESEGDSDIGSDFDIDDDPESGGEHSSGRENSQGSISGAASEQAQRP